MKWFVFFHSISMKIHNEEQRKQYMRIPDTSSVWNKIKVNWPELSCVYTCESGNGWELVHLLECALNRFDNLPSALFAI